MTTRDEAPEPTRIGCGDSSCIFGPPKGMHTNGEIVRRRDEAQARIAELEEKCYRAARQLLDQSLQITELEKECVRLQRIVDRLRSGGRVQD